MNYANLLTRPIQDIEFTRANLEIGEARSFIGSGNGGTRDESAGTTLHRKAIRLDRVLVTGGCGSIGSEIVRKLRGVAGCVYVGDRNERALAEVEATDDVRPVLLDVTKPRSVWAAMREARPDLVIHCAAYKHVPLMEDYTEDAIENNFGGTKLVVDALMQTDARFVFVSTDKAARPDGDLCVMGVTKWLAEKYVQAAAKRHGRCMSIVRFGNVLGSSGSVIETWERQLLDSEPLTVCFAERYFCTLGEAASLAISASLALNSPIMTLDMGEPVQLEDLARRFCESKGFPDHPIKPIALRKGDSISERLTRDDEELIERDNGLEVASA